MKKALLFAALLSQLVVVLGQERGYKKTNWASYRPFACFPNLYISVRSVGYEPVVKQYEYQFRIKNTSTQNVHFSLKIYIKKSNEELSAGRFDVGAGKEYTHISSYAKAIPEPNSDGFFSCNVTKYLENDKDDWTIPSYTCNNGIKVCDGNCNVKPTDKSKNSTSQNISNSTSTNTNISSNSEFVAVQQVAKFNGDWVKFLQRNYQYPESATKNKIKGKVVVSFTIDKDGNVVNVKAISGPPELFDAAEKLIQKSNGKWTPATLSTGPVPYHLTQSIIFSAPED